MKTSRNIHQCDWALLQRFSRSEVNESLYIKYSKKLKQVMRNSQQITGHYRCKV